MKYEIMYSEAFPIVKCQLERGEKLKAESDAMITMSGTIDVEGKMNGGLLSGLARKFLTGESFFCQELIASRGAGEVLLGHSLPGGILDLALNGSYGWRVQKGSYMASTEGIEFDTKMQNLSKGLFSGEGFFILNVKGSGTLFVSSFGAIHPLVLLMEKKSSLTMEIWLHGRTIWIIQSKKLPADGYLGLSQGNVW